MLESSNTIVIILSIKLEKKKIKPKSTKVGYYFNIVTDLTKDLLIAIFRT